jgi:glycosyltransferase involved in cell wall biosynthesis
MKIFFDHKIFSLQVFGGASKYFCEIIKRLPLESWDHSILFSDNEYIKSIPQIKTLQLFPRSYFRGKAYMMSFLNSIYTYLRLLNGRFDVFHQTDYATYYFSAIRHKKMVTTFHDMNYTVYYDSYPKKLRKRAHKLIRLQKKSVERADKIIAVSQNTKKDLVEFWGINPEKIVVIYHGIETKKNLEIVPNRYLDDPYVLYVGERSLFKNFDRFIHAFAILHSKHQELKLICTGRPMTHSEREMLKELGLFDIVISVPAQESTMVQLYRDAEMFVYPSYSEGFGMPILEAMANNCPVLVSNASCLPEVAGDAGLYFDPFDVSDIADKMGILYANPELRHELLIKCKKQLDKFSWEKSVNEHLKVYQSVSKEVNQ